MVQSSDGKLWGFGNNLYGQLASVALMGDKTAIPTRSTLHCCAVLRRVACLRFHERGGSEAGSKEDRRGCDEVQRRLGADLQSFGLDSTPLQDSATVVAVECGSDHTIVQTDDFRLWLFGSNRHGQLLRAENAGEWEFNPEPRPIVPCSLFDDQVRASCRPCAIPAERN